MYTPYVKFLSFRIFLTDEMRTYTNGLSKASKWTNTPVTTRGGPQSEKIWYQSLRLNNFRNDVPLNYVNIEYCS